MTRLPVDSWDVKPHLELPPYELNEACPVTGDTLELEDHHIFRRSFMAIGRENRDLYWVEYSDGEDTFVVRNRIALSPEAHLRITTNRARLEYRGHELWYIEGEEELNLNMRMRLLTPAEKISKPRRKAKASTPEERKLRTNYCIRTPKGEENVLPELQDALFERFQAEMGWSETVPPYFVWVAAAARALQ